MSSNWDHIQQVLGAEIQGKPLRVASKRTLFGITSGIEKAMDAIALEAAHAGHEHVPDADSSDAADLRNRINIRAVELGDAVTIGRADRYFIHQGRSAGFYIPSYPFDPAGEFDEFMQAAGARNLAEWYEAQGMTAEQYSSVDVLVAVAVRRRDRIWQALFLGGAQHLSNPGFVALASSGFIDRCSTQALEKIADFIL